MNRNTTIGLLVVFAALLLYVVLVQNPADQAKQNQTPTPGLAPAGRVWESLQADQILNVRIGDLAQGRSVAFGRTAATASWAVTEPESRPADQVTAASNAASLANLTYQSILTSTGDLSAFGVLSPTHVIEINLVDGSTLKASVGDKVPTGDNYYVTRGGDSSVMVINGATLEQFWGWLDRPPYLEPTTTLTPDISPTAAVSATAQAPTLEITPTAAVSATTAAPSPTP